MSLIIYNIHNATYKNKMAAFDYDWTLVNPKNANTFPKNVDDWEWIYPNVPDKLKQYHKEGYMIVIFTNQTKKWKCDQIKHVAERLAIPLFVVIAMDKKKHKPNPIMFNTLFVEHTIDTSESFFVGDAIGRKNDFSDRDMVFAETIGLTWFPPEKIFCEKTPIFDIINIPLSNTPEIIIMTGFPGAGKSTIARHICQNKNYIHIQGDVYKTSTKMIKASIEHIIQGKSIIFDATNSSFKKRLEYITIANKYNLPITCVHVSVSSNIAFKRNRLRMDKKQVPKIAYSVYSKYYNEPTEKEGFTLYVV